MNTDCTAKITEIFYSVDEFCKQIEPQFKKKAIGEDGKKRRNRAFKMSDSEIITILILFHLSGYRTLKAFYTQMICKEWRQYFPVVLSYNCFAEREQMVSLKLYLFLNNCCLSDCTGISIIDFSIRVCHNKRSRRHKTFQGFPTRAKGVWEVLRFQTTYHYQRPWRNRPMAVDASQCLDRTHILDAFWSSAISSECKGVGSWRNEGLKSRKGIH